MAVLKSGTLSFCELRVFRLVISSRLVNWEDRYSGAQPVMHLNAMMALR